MDLRSQTRFDKAVFCAVFHTGEVIFGRRMTIMEWQESVFVAGVDDDGVLRTWKDRKADRDAVLSPPVAVTRAFAESDRAKSFWA